MKYRTPVAILSDTYLAKPSEPWRIPNVDSLPVIEPRFATAPNHDDGFMPYVRDENLARPWALRHSWARASDRRARKGGRHRAHLLRPREPRAHDAAATAEGGADRRRHDIPALAVDDPDSTGDAELLVLGWGSTYGVTGPPPGARATRGRRSRPRTSAT